MNRKPLVSLLVLLLLLLAPTMGEAKVTASQVVGNALADDLTPDGVRWIRTADIMLGVYRDSGIYGLDDICRIVMEALEGRIQDDDLDAIFQTRVDKLRFLCCAQQWIFDCQRNIKEFDTDVRGAQKVRAYLKKAISGFDSHQRELKRAAQMAILVAMDVARKKNG